MTAKRLLFFSLMTATSISGCMIGNTITVEEEANAGAETDQVFELRTYTAAEGKFDDLLARFRDHTLRIFEKHGMTNVGYWTPQDEPLSTNTLIYVLAHPSREEAEQSWRDFSSDPEWQSVAEESQRDGRLIVGLERVFLDPTDFSPMR
ncbi:MAG: NIPSNAP family protein [Gemmatimonadota bacterium]|nr:NIPSNAP family protein [Gemmatimonadota bacterium]